MPAKASALSLATGKLSSTTTLTGSPWIITFVLNEESDALALVSTKFAIFLGLTARAAKTDKK